MWSCHISQFKQQEHMAQIRVPTNNIYSIFTINQSQGQRCPIAKQENYCVRSPKSKSNEDVDLNDLKDKQESKIKLQFIS